MFWFNFYVFIWSCALFVILFVIKGQALFQNVLVVAKFLFLAMYSKYLFLVFLFSVLLFFHFLVS